MSDFDPAIRDDAILFHGKWVPIISGGSDQGGDGGSQGNSGSGDNGDGTDDGTSGGNTGGDGGGSEGAGRTFTQDEVNALMAREVSRATRGKLDPTELGFQSAKEATEFVSSAKQKADEAKTEAEKALEEAKTQAADQARNEVLSKANERLVAADFKVAAASKGIIDPGDALLIARTLPLWQDVQVEDKGDDVLITGLDDKFFEDLKAAKPHLFKAEGNGQGGSGDGDAGAGAGNNGANTDALSPEQLRKIYPHLPLPAST